MYCLTGQTFTVRRARGKEHLVTIDRFPWHGGIQKREVISNVMRKCLRCRSSTSVITTKWLRVVRANCKGHLTLKSVLVLVSICADNVSNYTEGKCHYWILSNQIGAANILATSTKTCLKWLDVLFPSPCAQWTSGPQDYVMYMYMHRKNEILVPSNCQTKQALGFKLGDFTNYPKDYMRPKNQIASPIRNLRVGFI